MQVTEDGNIAEHIKVMMNIVDQLTCLGEKLAAHLVVTNLLCSLLALHNISITALKSRSEGDLTLELVKSKLPRIPKSSRSM